MAAERNGYIYTTMHDFKTHIARYMAMLERGDYRGLMLRRGLRGPVVGVVSSLDGLKIWERRQAGSQKHAQNRAQNQALDSNTEKSDAKRGVD